jgi:hypothetical protein
MPAAIAAQNTVETSIAETDLIHHGDLLTLMSSAASNMTGAEQSTRKVFLDARRLRRKSDLRSLPQRAANRRSVAQAYGKILRQPKVVVKILDRSNRPLAILYGAVKTPQRFQIRRPVYLNELLIVAGGLTEKSSGDILIFRPKVDCPAPVEEKPDAHADGGKNRKNSLRQAKPADGASYINIKISDLLAGKKDANLQILSGDIVTVVEAEPST